MASLRSLRPRPTASAAAAALRIAAAVLLAAFAFSPRVRPAKPPAVVVDGFAYAPNFVTKIVSSDSGREPVGLLEIPTKEEGDDGPDDVDASAGAPSPAEEEEEEEEEEDATTNVVVSGGGRRPIATRFPPEPNGYLHLGHAKAVCFNFAVARMFDGACNMRLDDTNPSKEGQEYVDSILEDVRWIQSGLTPLSSSDEGKSDPSDAGPWNGPVRKTSDIFGLLYDCAVSLIKSGDAYVDSLSAEEMREYRGTLTEPGKRSPYRNRTVEENLEMFEKMKDGIYEDGAHVLRAKIDMSSPNLNMRDPVLYRIKNEPHQATGDEWCLYPMYDFSHPIADAVEGISHSLCTLEFEDHRPLYDWTIEKLGPTGLLGEGRPRQIEFSRLNLKYTVLSKRKLIRLVTENHVAGWDDPRMLTLSGMRRRGVPPAALRLFCERVGISKSDSNIDYAVLEDCVREVMDDGCGRAFAIEKPLKVALANWDDESRLEEFVVPRHPKRPEMGDRSIPFGKNLYIDRSDFFDLDGPEGVANGGRPPRGFKRLLPDGGQVRLKFAYVIRCEEVARDPDTNEPVELKCSYRPETKSGATPEGEKRVKGIVQWLEQSTAREVEINRYDRLFTTEEPGRDSGDFVKDVNPNSLEVVKGAMVEPSVAADATEFLSEMDADTEGGERRYPSQLSYQFERSGYFALDASSTTDRLAFNRVATLRDTWGGGEQDDAAKKGGQKRSRGGGGGGAGGDKPRRRGGGGGGNAPVLEDARRIALRAATILSAKPHPDADGLLVCKVDCGDTAEPEDSRPSEPAGPRTVVAGLAGKIPIETLAGRKVVALTNLKPARMRGIESTAVLLAASEPSSGDDGEETVELLTVPESVPNGALLSFEGMEPCQPDALLKSKGAVKVWDRVKAELRVDEKGEATYARDGNVHRIVAEGSVPATCESLRSTIVQ